MATVEFAVVLPVIIATLLGVWEVGCALTVEEILWNAASVGGRAASTGLNSATQVQAAVTNYLALAGLPTQNVTVTVSDLTSPGTDPAARERLEAELAAAGPAALHSRLATLDPGAAVGILPSNGRRIVRALEVIELSGQPFTATLPRYDSLYPAVQIGLRVSRGELDRRIAVRVASMWRDGLVGEVRGLEQAGLRESRTASQALGYAQVLRFLAGEWGEDEAREQTVKATRRFARRQESWFRRDPRVIWLDAGPGADLPAQAVATIGRWVSSPGDSSPGDSSPKDMAPRTTS